MGRSWEEEIKSFAAGAAEDQLAFTIDMCDTNSYTLNAGGSDRVAEMVSEKLGGVLPLEETVHAEAFGDHHILRTGRGPGGIYLLGHLDTVFPPDHPFQECRTEGDWLVGPGAGDMKGGLAVIVYALLALSRTGVLADLDLTLILGADEETGAETSRAIYERERQRATACLVAECAGPAGEAVISRNGKAGLKLECFGEDVHVGRAVAGKKSAVVEIAHKVIALEQLNGCIEGVTVNAGRIEGGLGPCTVPAYASAIVDVRWLDEGHYDLVMKRIREVVDGPSHTGCVSRLAVLNHRPAMPLTAGSEALYRKLVEAGGKLGMTVGREHRRGTSDGNFFGSAGVPTLDGLGPICRDDHTPRERILISSLGERTALLAALLSGMAGRPGFSSGT